MFFLLWDLKVHDRIHKSKPLDPVISQMNPINPLPSYNLTLILVLSLPLCRTLDFILIWQLTEANFDLTYLNPTVVIFAATSEIPQCSTTSVSMVMFQLPPCNVTEKKLLGLVDKKWCPNVLTARRLTTFHCNSVVKRLGIRRTICNNVCETL
jgi:hypothetical protein